MAAGNWSDLRVRIVSAVAMVGIGGAAIWAGGLPFAALVTLACAAMIWELARMTSPGASRSQALAAAVLSMLTLIAAIMLPPPYGVACLVFPALGLLATPRQLRVQTALYALLIGFAGFTLIALRSLGMAPLLWLVAVVVISDIAGYFAGRALGGPKFWPAISPKKTWSGTLAGWLGAVLVGAGFMAAAGAPAAIMLLSPLVGFAGQLGDILESWFKRRTGVKDSSSLIPGHGGVLDRFDALLIAALAVLIFGLIIDLPLPV